MIFLPEKSACLEASFKISLVFSVNIPSIFLMVELPIFFFSFSAKSLIIFFETILVFIFSILGLGCFEIGK